MKIWLHIDGRQSGPFTIEQIEKMDITPRTAVWYEGLANWMTAADAPVTAKILANRESSQAVSEVSSEVTTEEISEVKETAEIDEEAAEAESAETESESMSHADGEELAESAEESFEESVPANPYFESAPWMQQPMPQGASWAQPQQPAVKKPSNLLWLSILLTVLCCNPFSIAAIISGAVVNNRNNNGDIEGARRTNEVTQWLIAISIVLFIIFLPLLMIAM